MNAQELANAITGQASKGSSQQGSQVIKRRALAKAITLLESTLEGDRKEADALISAVLPSTGRSLRLGISGVPGVGKSTFIEVLGLYLISLGHKLAVLAIDPSSTVSGGSVLGDKTRMERLSVHPDAFIRPSPSKGVLGGVAERTRESILLCEAAGFDVVIVETVGVGQSETTVSLMTDLFILMQLPNAGDDLQAIKKGVMEIADLVVINKADLDPDAATRAQAQITSAMRLYGFHGNPSKLEGYAEHGESVGAEINKKTISQLHETGVRKPAQSSAHAASSASVPPRAPTARVLQLSALEQRGVEEFWQTVLAHQSFRVHSGQWLAKRQSQALAGMWERVDWELKRSFKEYASVKALLPSVLSEVSQGLTAPSVAARRLLSAYAGRINGA